MGALTRAQIVTQGLSLAGRTDLTTSANVWFNAWLRQAYRSWSWPYLHKRTKDISLAAAATSLNFGAGSTETLEVAHIFDPIRIYTSDKSLRDNMRVRSLLDDTAHTDEDLLATTDTGQPQTCRIRPYIGTWGKWTIYPDRIPNRAYLLAIDYLYQPADLSDDATVPVYPNDETMIQAVRVYAMKYNHDETGAEEQALEAMKQGDKVRYGVANGINDRTDLDSRVFRGSAIRGGRWLDYW